MAHHPYPSPSMFDRPLSKPRAPRFKVAAPHVVLRTKIYTYRHETHTHPLGVQSMRAHSLRSYRAEQCSGYRSAIEVKVANIVGKMVDKYVPLPQPPNSVHGYNPACPGTKTGLRLHWKTPVRQTPLSPVNVGNQYDLRQTGTQDECQSLN